MKEADLVNLLSIINRAYSTPVKWVMSLQLARELRAVKRFKAGLRKWLGPVRGRR